MAHPKKCYGAGMTKISIDRKISIAVVVAMFCQGCYFIWDTSAAYAQMNYTTARVINLEKKADIYADMLQRMTRVEEGIKATNDKIDYLIGYKQPKNR